MTKVHLDNNCKNHNRSALKIGILTLPFNNNYGGYLQAYALLTVLKKMGHDVEIIYRRHNKPSWKELIIPTCKNIIKKIIGWNVFSIIPNNEKVFLAKGAAMLTFVNKYIVPRTKPIYSTKALKKQITDKYDVIIVGSDQVWRPEYVPNIEDYFLTFLSDNTKRIAYAASFGTDQPEYSEEEKKECGIGIMKFDMVSVREESALNVISSFGWKCKKKPIQVLDPTMLLSKDHYESLIASENSNAKGKILTYILDNNEYTQEIVKEISTEHGLPTLAIIDGEKWKNIEYVMPSIESWLSSLRDAEFVITDSFHGTVFSIIFNKPFVALANAERGADRFVSLLSQFGLMNRLYSEGKNYQKSDIDWKPVNVILENQVSESISVLQNIK